MEKELKINFSKLISKNAKFFMIVKGKKKGIEVFLSCANENSQRKYSFCLIDNKLHTKDENHLYFTKINSKNLTQLIKFSLAEKNEFYLEKDDKKINMRKYDINSFLEFLKRENMKE